MSDVTLRDATEGDAAAIQRVARQSWHEAYDEIMGAETVQSTVDSWFDPDRLVRDDILPDDRPLFVATISDDVVGGSSKGFRTTATRNDITSTGSTSIRPTTGRESERDCSNDSNGQQSTVGHARWN
ncbi:hypothetical protein [Halovivax ruber]|uniref:hypothetical protein n=1 Tax=Halovivax ruber TaxID=387341 RepID=UPI001FE062A5|nr:hypothetical protein [Halovivax ruber]